MSRPPSPEKQRARQRGERTYLGAPCQFAHLGERYTSTGACVVCVRLRDAARHEARRDVAAE